VTHQAAPPVRVLWDADGSPDSIVTLLYFLQHPALQVASLTVSCGEADPETYAPYLPRLLARLGRPGIPAAAGRAAPLRGHNAFPPPWREAVNRFLDIELPPAGAALSPLPAAALIVDTIHAAPDPVLVFISGTHTNLAQALRLDPRIRGKIAALHVMGGAVYVPGNIAVEWPAIDNQVAEWNIWVDPLAASEVFCAGLPLHLTPLDATNQVLWTRQDAVAWEAAGTPEATLAAEILRWLLEYVGQVAPNGFFLFDLLAAVHVTDPHLSHSECLPLRVVTEPGPHQGRTVIVPGHPANATVYLAPDAAAVKRRVAQILGRPRHA
jgi:pyrimidine-specific ribonucleoside hydrolase